jgi:hypothetical protein
VFDPYVVLEIPPEPDDKIGGEGVRVIVVVLKDLILNAIETNQAVACAYPYKGTVVLYDPGHKRLRQTVLGSNGAHGLCPGAGDPAACHKQQQPKGGGALWIGLADHHALGVILVAVSFERYRFFTVYSCGRMETKKAKSIAILLICLATLVLILLVVDIGMVRQAETGLSDALPGGLREGMLYTYLLLFLTSLVLFTLTRSVKNRYNTLANLLFLVNGFVILVMVGLYLSDLLKNM